MKHGTSSASAVSADDYFTTVPDKPRPLIDQELQRLAQVSPSVARMFAAGRCPKCELNRSSRYHRSVCDPPKPLKALSAPSQPWEARPARKRAA